MCCVAHRRQCCQYTRSKSHCLRYIYQVNRAALAHSAPHHTRLPSDMHDTQTMSAPVHDTIPVAAAASNTSTKMNNYAYTTLITRASYLAGVIILAHTLRKHRTQYPLLVYYTPGLQPDALHALQLEAAQHPHQLLLRPCQMLLPRTDIHITLIAERFGDTWTKLRVFDAVEYDTVCYLDADMAIYNSNMDAVFDAAATLPADGLAANHACVCNLDRDSWAPQDWNVGNCAYTPLSHPAALTQPTPVTPHSRRTHHLLNSGMFVYHPSVKLRDSMLEYFNTSAKLGEYDFPDQDFLTEFFHHKWQSLGWQYNALKTMRYIHPNIWRDDAVVCLHYIVDKPWVTRVSADGTAGFNGKDGVTHSWWWSEYADWVQQRQEQKADDVLRLVRQYAAKDDGTDNDDPDMRAIGSKVQAFANNKK